MTKPKLFNGTTIIEFETDAEHDAYVASISPTPDLTDFIKNAEHELIGKQVIKDLYVALRQQNLTQAQEGDLLNRLTGVLMALGFGFIRGSRVIANNLTVAGSLTQGRKDFLLAKIDAAILLL